MKEYAALIVDDALYRFRLRVFALAEEPGNVRLACRMMGIHPSTFYRWRRQALRFGDGRTLLELSETVEMDGRPVRTPEALPGSEGYPTGWWAEVERLMRQNDRGAHQVRSQHLSGMGDKGLHAVRDEVLPRATARDPTASPSRRTDAVGVRGFLEH